MKNNFLPLLFILFCTICSAQKLTEKFKYKATYDFTWQIDSTDAKSVQNEEMLLYMGEEISTFISNGRHIGDSITATYDSREKTSETLTEMHYKIPGSKVKYYIEKNLTSNEVIFKERIINDYYSYSEELKNMNWNILPETKNITGFQAQKATISFRGRNYIAWFTTEIPISDGPYKFKGLPGLILKIADEEEFYIFELSSFKKLKDPIFDIEKGKNYLETTRSELEQIRKDYNADPYTALDNSGIVINFRGERQRFLKEHREKIKKQNNPIELE
jgi:GLPGLI family protein